MYNLTKKVEYIFSEIIDLSKNENNLNKKKILNVELRTIVISMIVFV